MKRRNGREKEEVRGKGEGGNFFKSNQSSQNSQCGDCIFLWKPYEGLRFVPLFIWATQHVDIEA